jgi:hypothetical protein
MKKKFLLGLLVAALMPGMAALPAIADSPPSGEVIVGGNAAGTHGGTVLEPGYNDVTGTITYVSTPQGTAHPVPTNVRATAPFYLPVYPTSSLTGALAGVRLNCKHVPTDNCPDHGPGIAEIAEGFEHGVYGGGVAGHDHLFAPPGSGGDFNVAWRPIVVLFTKSSYVTHITTLTELEGLREAGKVEEIPLDGTFAPLGDLNLTFHCSVVSASVYSHGTPFTPAS